MTSKRTRAASRSRTLRNTIFGPPPILEYESSAEYQRLLDRLYADLKPTDFIEESYVHDIAYWMWDLWRWRQMKICSIDAKWFNAFRWAYILPPNQRLAYIGKTDEVDIKSVIKNVNAPMSEEDKKNGKRSTRRLMKCLGRRNRPTRLQTLWPNLFQSGISLPLGCSWKSSITLNASIK
jgi:hypothetical protein